MPAIAQQLIRFLFIAVVQTGAIVAVQQTLEGVVDYIRNALKSDGGLTDAETNDVMLNETLDALAIVGITVASLKSKIPLRLADKLGLGLSQQTKKTLSTKQSAAVSQAVTKGALQPTVLKSVLQKLVSPLATILIFGPLLVQGLGDQFTFSPKTANDFYEGLFGFRPRPDLDPVSGFTPATYTAGEFLELFNQLKSAGAVGINAPYAFQTQLFNQTTLAGLVNYIVGNNILSGKKSDKTAIRTELSKYLLKMGSSGSGTPAAGGGAPAAGVSVPAAAPVQIKVYTGVVAGGTLGTPSEFIARPDDMIQNTEELKAAAKNNLAAFVQALPGKFYYEIGIQNTVRTRSGFTQKGEAVRIISGYYKNGNPRYKTVYHKFAVMKLGVTDENGRNVKLGTIVLGPVNVVDYQPSPVELTQIQNQITPELFTNDITDIQEIITPAPVGITTAAGTNPNPPTNTATSATPSASPTSPGTPVRFIASNTSFTIPAGGEIFIPTQPRGIVPTVYARSGDIVRVFNLESLVPRYMCGPYGCYKDDAGNEVRVNSASQVWDLAVKRFKDRTGMDYYSLKQQNIADVQAAFGRGRLSELPNQLRTFEGPNAFEDFIAFLGALLPGGDVDISGMGIQLNDAARNAHTLGQFYTAVGKPLPSLADRALLYEQLGLGAKSTYTGTAEQNNRLLALLKTAT